MIVKVRRVGGFAGLQEDLAALDTAHLAPEARGAVSACLAEIERLVAREERIGLDQLRFEIDVEGEGGAPRTTIVVVDEGDPHDPLRSQVEQLVGLAAAQPAASGGTR